MKNTLGISIRFGIKIATIFTALVLMLPMFACSNDGTNEEVMFDTTTEEGQLMDTNSKFLVSNLPMITFRADNLHRLI